MHKNGCKEWRVVYFTRGSQNQNVDHTVSISEQQAKKEEYCVRCVMVL